MKYDIAILTDHRWLNPSSTDWYTKQVIQEDHLLQKELEELGLKVVRLDWADPNFDWTTTRFAMIRTVWDYSERWEEFDAWFTATSALTRFINPAELIRWNLDKHYLADLQSAGVNIPPTIFMEKGNTNTLQTIWETTDWTEAVLKPTVSAGGRHTYRILKQDIADHELILTELLTKEAMMLQEFQRNVVEKGEVSLMFAGNRITHAVIKKVKSGDFRVQDDFGGTVKIYSPTFEEIEFAQRVISVCKTPPICGRVDMIWDNNGNPAVGELEIIEPEMWFRLAPKAAKAVADVVLAMVKP